GSAAAYRVVIREVLPLNSGAVRVPVTKASVRLEERDDDAGSGHVWHPNGDWIELYNPNPQSVLLGGYYLTDNPKDLKKWRFPDAVQIGGTAPGVGQATADPYLIIWADGDPEQSVYDPATGTWHLHADFSIDEEGGDTIILVAPDGETIIDQLAVIRPDLNGDGFAESDVSIVPDPATGAPKPCWQPTPAVANAPAGIGFGQLVQSQPLADEPVRVEIQVFGSDAALVWLNFYSANDTSPQRVAMRDDGQDGDRVAGDGIFTGAIPGEYQIPIEPEPGESFESFLRGLESVRVLYAIEVTTSNFLTLWYPRERLNPTGGGVNLVPPEAESRLAYAVTTVGLALNEFMAVNDGTVLDPLGRSAEWIELYNFGTASIPLETDGGQAIFDLSGRLDGGEEPLYGSPILPGEHRVFWLGVDPPAVLPEGGAARDGYVPGIGLRGAGESILIRSGKLVIDGLDYRSIPQYAGVSVGRCPDGEPGIALIHLLAPTPGAANACGAGNLAPVFVDDASAAAVLWEEESAGRIRITVRATDPDGEIPIRSGTVAARILWGEGSSPTEWQATSFVEADIVEQQGRRLTLSHVLEIASDAVHRFYVAVEDDRGAVAYRSAAGTSAEPPSVDDAFAFRTNVAPPAVTLSELHIALAGDPLPSFLEIRNDGDEAIDLRGAYIVQGTREGDRIGWRIPDVDRAIIPPGGFLVICLGGDGEICDIVADLDASATGGTFRLFGPLAEGNLGLDTFTYRSSDVPSEPGMSMVPIASGLAARPSTPGSPNGEPPAFAWPLGVTRSPIDPEIADAVIVRIGVKDPDAADGLSAVVLRGFAYDEAGQLIRERTLSTADPGSASFIAREGTDGEGFERIAFNTTDLSFASPRVLVRYFFQATDRDGEVAYLGADGPSAGAPDPAVYFAFRKGYAPPPISINEIPAPGATWVELYNGGDSPVDVAGMRLVAVAAGQPDPGDTLGWEIPAGAGTEIGAKGLAAIAADPLGLDTAYGGTLRLYASLADGNGTIDSLTWPALGGQPSGGSFGRTPDGAASTGLFPEATPGEANPAGGALFVRGDANGDGAVNVSDVSRILYGLFGDLGLPSCLDAADVNDDGRVNVSDPSALLLYLFGDGGPPEPPFPEAGADPTEDDLGCPPGA
ncbi:MAG: lamin tail domain-containing protein, partial [Planctomycetes bacterium]|nr:lamin tail domain-containing protein [Planctomycetota bacterium]